MDHLRQRTPRDLLPRLKGQSVALPVGDASVTVKVGDIVQASLRTKEADEARSRHAVADGALKRFWEAQRSGPVRLTHKQAQALAGVFFREFTTSHDEDPGEAERWLAEHRDDLLARYGQLGRAALMISKEARQRSSREARFGRLADNLLTREGLVIDADSRTRLVEAIAEARSDAALGLFQGALPILRERWERRSRAAYMAIRLAVSLEAYSAACLDLITGNENAPHRHGERLPDWLAKLPALEQFPDDTEGWRALDRKLVGRALGFRNKVRESQGIINETVFHNDGAIPGVVEYEAVARGLEAWRLAVTLRRAHGIEAAKPVWDYVEALERIEARHSRSSA